MAPLQPQVSKTVSWWLMRLSSNLSAVAKISSFCKFTALSWLKTYGKLVNGSVREGLVIWIQ